MLKPTDGRRLPRPGAPVGRGPGDPDCAASPKRGGTHVGARRCVRPEPHPWARCHRAAGAAEGREPRLQHRPPQVSLTGWATGAVRELEYYVSLYTDTPSSSPSTTPRRRCAPRLTRATASARARARSTRRCVPVHRAGRRQRRPLRVRRDNVPHARRTASSAPTPWTGASALVSSCPAPTRGVGFLFSNGWRPADRVKHPTRRRAERRWLVFLAW